MLKGTISCLTILHLIETTNVLNEDCVESAVYNITSGTGVSEAINEAIPSVKPKSSTFSRGFSKYFTLRRKFNV
jgi:hypothetical protein